MDCNIYITHAMQVCTVADDDLIAAKEQHSNGRQSDRERKFEW